MRTILIAALLPLSACGNAFDRGSDSPGVTGSGTGTSRSYDVTGFTAVALAGSDDVDVRVGPAFSVRAEGDAAALDRLTIERDGDTLKVGHRNGISYSGKGAKIFVTMPAIEGASIGGSGDLTVDRASGKEFEGKLAGSGTLRLPALAVGDADFSIAGSGDISAAGTAKMLDVKIAGSGSLDAAGLVASQAEIALMGSGDVRATVKGDAKISAVGSGDIDLGPDARCNTTKLGSGDVRCGR